MVQDLASLCRDDKHTLAFICNRCTCSISAKKLTNLGTGTIQGDKVLWIMSLLLYASARLRLCHIRTKPIGSYAFGCQLGLNLISCNAVN